MAALFIVLGLGYQSPVSSTDQKPSDLLKLNQEEAMDSYEIYSLLLRRWRPEIKDWRIVAETRAFTFCLKPTQEFTATYGVVLEDYALKNRRTFILERRFSIGDYTLATPQEWTDMQRHRVLAVSAIGFNPDRTRAGACYAVGNNHANSGMCMFLFKQDGIWKYDTDYRGGCGFGGSIFE
jgi:hypothetical protein